MPVAPTPAATANASAPSRTIFAAGSSLDIA
jgi:hypothetical protein